MLKKRQANSFLVVDAEIPEDGNKVWSQLSNLSKHMYLHVNSKSHISTYIKNLWIIQDKT